MSKFWAKTVPITGNTNQSDFQQDTKVNSISKMSLIQVQRSSATCRAPSPLPFDKAKSRNSKRPKKQRH